MAWEGPEAERFHAMYQSQMRPQILAAAACLSQASTELRAQAADQRRASSNENAIRWIGGSPFIPGGGLTDDIGELLEDIWNFGRRIFDGILDVDTILHASHYLLRHLQKSFTVAPTGIKPFFVDKVDDLIGVGKLFGQYGSRVLGALGAGVSLWTLPGDIRELGQDISDMERANTSSEWYEAIEQFGYSYSDVLLSAGSIFLGVSAFGGPAAPVVAAIGVGLLAGGGIIKGSAFLYDHLRDPIADGLKQTYDFLSDRAQDVSRWIAEETREIRAEFVEASNEVNREIVE